MSFLKEGLFMIHIGVDNKKLLLAINSILEELHNLKQNGITDNELIKAKNIQNTNYALSLQTPNNISQYYGLIELFHNSKDYTYSKVKKRYNQITKEDLNNIIKTIFKKENMNIFIYGCNNKPDKKDLFDF
jgi:predicted Zn-dependent peptidase